MEWIKPKALLEAIARGNGSTSGLIEGVIKRAALGVLRAKAQHLTQDGALSADAEVPKQFWAVGKHSLNGSWATGDFSASVTMDKSRPLSRDRNRNIWIEAFGVTFAKDDAIALGAVFDDNATNPPALGGQAVEAETLEDWAARMVECGLGVKGFTGAILKASWRGPEDTVPLVKIAEGALSEAWKGTGYQGRGRRPGHLKLEGSS